MNTASAHVELRNVALLFVVACFWIAVALTGGRLFAGIAPPPWTDAVRQCATACLLFAGLYTLARTGIRDLRPLSSLGFVRRPTAGREFGWGAALGWGIAIALIAPAVLTGSLNLSWTPDASHVLPLLRSAVALAAFALNVQLIVAGLPARLLVRAAGPSWMIVGVMLLAFCLVLSGFAGNDGGILFTIITAAVFCLAFLRTRALWFGLGLQLGWTLILQLLFGASSPYTPLTSGLLRAEMSGSFRLTGGFAGPESSLFAPWIVLAALVILVRVTRDYAWHYTFQPLEGAGYPVEIPPPAGHEREQTHAAVPLVQIGSITPATPAIPAPEKLP